MKTFARLVVSVMPGGIAVIVAIAEPTGRLRWLLIALGIAGLVASAVWNVVIPYRRWNGAERPR